MGEIADMMLDGTMCQYCGEWMDNGNDGPGYPMSCADFSKPKEKPKKKIKKAKAKGAQ